jgi:hypothetical protein
MLRNPEPVTHNKSPITLSEVARCIRDGKLESERCNLAESRIVQSVFDEVRKQGGYLGGNAKGKAGTR